MRLIRWLFVWLSLSLVLCFSNCTPIKVGVSEVSIELTDYPEERSWFNYLCSEELGGRYSGSIGIKKAALYLSNIIGDEKQLVIDTFSTDKCEMVNLVYHISGVNDSLVVLGAHYDAYGYLNGIPYPGANDNMSGVAVLLKLIKNIQDHNIRPRYSLEFCFFDGEEIGRYGSKRFVSTCVKDIKLYINVDTCGNSDTELGLYYSQRISSLSKSFSEMINDLKMRCELYAPVNYTTDCEPFKQCNIPFVAIGSVSLPIYLHSNRG